MMTTAHETRVEAALRAVVATEAHYDGPPSGFIVPDLIMENARSAFLAADAASPASADLQMSRKESWAEYDSKRPRGDISAKPAFDAGFDAGVVAAIMNGKYRAASPASGWNEAIEACARIVETTPLSAGNEALAYEMRAMMRDASPASGVTEEQVAQAICCPGGCLRETGPAPHDCWAGKRREEREQTRAVMAMIRGHET